MAFAGRLQGACTCDGMPLHMIIMTSPHTVLLPLNQQGGRAPATTRSLTGTVAPWRLSESTTSVAVCAAYTSHTRNPKTLQPSLNFLHISWLGISYCRDHMHRLLMDLQALHDAPAAALKEAFLATDQEVGRGGVDAYMLDRVGSGEGIFFVSSH